MKIILWLLEYVIRGNYALQNFRKMNWGNKLICWTLKTPVGKNIQYRTDPKYEIEKKILLYQFLFKGTLPGNKTFLWI